MMTSNKALRLALQRLAAVPCAMIAPQHGSVIATTQDIDTVMKHLFAAQGVGIDQIVDEGTELSLDDFIALRTRVGGNES